MAGSVDNCPPKTGSDHADQFYTEEPNPNDVVTAILTEYSDIPKDELIPHLKRVRNEAWAIFKYPCIGWWNFLDLSISQSPQYDVILKRLRAEETLLDLGCCFGQDVRKLVFDGAPASNITALELEQSFIDLGYELFNDQAKLQSKFIAADFLTSSDEELKDGAFDMIHAASFFHLFSWSDQKKAMSRAVRLLKPKPSSMIFGRQTGAAEPGVSRSKAFPTGEAYRHSYDSWKSLVGEVSDELGIKLGVDCAFAKSGGQMRDGAEIFLFRFTITRL